MGATKYLHQEDVERKESLQTYLTESSNGLLHIRAFGWEYEALAEGYRLLDASQKPFYFILTTQCWFGLVMDLVILCMAIIVLPGVFDREISTTATGVALTLITLINLSDGLSGLLENWTAVETRLLALGRIRNLTRAVPQEQPRDGEVPPNWPQHGCLDMDNVVARYE